MKFKITGIDEIEKQLADLQRRAEALSGEHELRLSDVLTSEFMLLHTDFESVDLMFEASGYDVQSLEDLEAIPDGAWDGFISARTRFDSWQSLIDAATTAYFERRLHGEA